MSAVPENEAVVTVTVADTFWTRFRGWMFKDSIERNEALLLTHSSAIHMFFMRFEIDAIFLGRNMEALKLCERLRPNRSIASCPGADAILECRAGFIAEHHITRDHMIEFLPGAKSGAGPQRARFVRASTKPI